MGRKRVSTGDKMIAFRKKNRIARSEMARRCGAPEGLITALEEDGWITHPNIAARVCAEYGLGVTDYNRLVSKCHKAKTLPAPKPRPEAKGYSFPKSAFRRKEVEDIILDKDWL